MQMKPYGIEPATFRFVAQYLNHCATAVPFWFLKLIVIYISLYSKMKIDTKLLQQAASPWYDRI